MHRVRGFANSFFAPLRGRSAFGPFLAIAAAGLILRTGTLCLTGVRPVSDFAVFEELAASTARGDGVAYSGPAGAEDLRIYQERRLDAAPVPTMWRAPGPALAGGALYALFGRRPWLYGALNLFAGLWMLWPLYLLGDRLGGRETGLAAAGLWALCPSAAAATALFGGDLLHTVLLVAAAERLTRPGGGLRRPFAAGSFGALACLFRPTAPLLLLPAALTEGRRPARLAAFLAGFLLLSLPWAARNYLRFGSWTPFAANVGDTFARHTAAMSRGRAPVDAAWRSAATEAERSRRGFRAGLANLGFLWRSGPGTALAAHATAFLDAFGADRQMVYWSAGPGRSGLMRLSSAFYWTLCLFALGAWLTRRPETGFLGWHFLGTVFVYTLASGIDRYHFPILPFLCLLAGLALSPTERYS